MSLDAPVTKMDTEKGENERLDYAVSSMQGYRITMEDAHKVDLNLDPRSSTSFFGVYDGHGGHAVSKYCAKHLHIELHKDAGFRSELAAAIRRTFLGMDTKMASRKAGKELCEYGGSEYWDNYKKEIRAARFNFCGEKPQYEGPKSEGCAAIVVLIRGNQIFVGNAGDCRCVLSRNELAIDLSTDFRPGLPGERQRIVNAGRTVTANPARGNIPRIDGGISISRSLGDLDYKGVEGLSAEQQPMTAHPEVRIQDITEDAQFLIIACDGVWDCMTSQQAVDFVRIYLDSNIGLSVICEALLQHCLALPRGIDNMTVMLVRFKNPGGGAPNVVNP